MSNGVVPDPKAYRLDQAWIAQRNRRAHQRILIEVAVFFGLIALAMTMGVPLFGLAAVFAAVFVVGDLYLMTKRRRWDSAARIEVFDDGLRFHSLVHQPIILHWKELRAHRQEALNSGISAIILTPDSGGGDIRIEGYENLGELYEIIAHQLGDDA